MDRPSTCWDMLGGRYTQSDSARAEPIRYGCRFWCTKWGANWRNLANTSEPSECGADAALCQIILTTCFFFRPRRSIMYINAAYCYRRSSVVCQSVCLFVTVVSPAKRLNRSAAVWVGLTTRVSPGN